MFSQRFNKEIVITNHAKLRMRERDISDKDAKHLWAFKFFENRNDNLICAVLVLESSIVIKTVMFHFCL